MVVAKEIALLGLLVLALAGAADTEDSSTRRNSYHRGRRLVQQTVECFLYKVDFQYIDPADAPEEKWQCELQGADAASTGLVFVDVDGLDFGDFDGAGAEVTLLAQGAVIRDGTLKIPKGATQRFNKVEGRGPANKARGIGNGNGNGNSQQGRRLAPGTGTRKVLAVRVIAPDVATTSTASEISNTIFGTTGDTCNLKERMVTCSYGDLIIEPFSGTVNGKAISNGVYEVSITQNVINTTYSNVQNYVVNKLTSDLGTLTNNFDHVMLCLPAGTSGGGWIAYGYIGGYITVYNNIWCNYPSAQVHEIGHNIGLHHAGEAGFGEYDDQTGMMGYSYGQNTTNMCYNPAKSWQLGWYTSRRLSLDLASQGPFTGDLIGIVDYQHTGATGKYVTVQVVPPVPGAPAIYVGFNRQAGLNVGTQEGQNQVTVTSQPVDHKSQLLAKLQNGGQFTLNNFWYGDQLVIKVNTLSTTGSPPTANVKISLNGCTSNADCKDGDACLVGTCGTYGTCSYSWVGTSCPGNFVMDLFTDSYPAQTSWKVQNLCNGGTTVLSGGNYNSPRTRYTSAATLGKSRFRLTVSDSNGDGLSAGNATFTANFTATFDGLPVAMGIGNFGFQVVGEFGTPCPTPAPTPLPTPPPTPLPTPPPTPLPTPPPTPKPTPLPTPPPTLPATWKPVFSDGFESGFTIFKAASTTECKISTLFYQGSKSMELNNKLATSYGYTASNYDVSTSSQLRASFFLYTQNLVSTDKFYLEYKTDINANWVTVGTFTYGTAPVTTNKKWLSSGIITWGRPSGVTWVNLRVRSFFSTNKKKVNVDNFVFEALS